MCSRRPLLSVALLLTLFNTLSAQSYKTAVGLRIDNGLSITAKQHIYRKWTGEGILHTGFNDQELGLTLLAEKHQKILFRGINLYWGAGGHIYQLVDNRDKYNPEKYTVSGLSGIGGAEISLGRINLAVDWKPELHLSGAGTDLFDWNGASISVRYIFVKRDRRSIKDWNVWDKFKTSQRKQKQRRSFW